MTAEASSVDSIVRCGVVGDPIAHSLSPTLHRAGYAALGLTHHGYDASRVPSGGLAHHVAALDASWRGLSVTAPLKREALEIAATATDRARLAGGANTLVRDVDRPERWHADNTDLPGAVAAIAERHPAPVRSALILGAGATAASTGLALLEGGAQMISVAARDAERAAPTIEALAAHPSGARVQLVDLASYSAGEELSEAIDVVVSTVPAAAQTPELCARVAEIPVLFEVVYDPWPTPVVAAHHGTVVSGMDLLVHQAALQFEMFTGRGAPLAQMRDAGEQALRLRRR